MMESRATEPDEERYDALSTLKEQGGWIESHPGSIKLSLEGFIPDHNKISISEYERVIAELKVTDFKFAYYVAARVLDFHHGYQKNELIKWCGLTSPDVLAAILKINTRLFGFIGSFSMSELGGDTVERGLSLLYAFKLLVENKLDETAVNMINTLGVADRSSSQLFTPPSMLSNHQGECYISGKPFDKAVAEISQFGGFTLTDALKEEASRTAINLLESFKYELPLSSQYTHR